MAEKKLVQTNFSMIAGLDIGNGYVKGGTLVNGEKTGIDFLSGVAFQTSHYGVPVPESEAESTVKDIFNEMEASFDSPAVNDSTRRLFGLRAISSGKSMEEFDVSSTLSKAQQDLSGILILGSVAGKVLQTYWNVNKSLPNDILYVKVRLALALPITEYKQYRKIYAAKFKDGSHMVSIHNFERTVRIQIEVEDVQVLAEGASAQYAISYSENSLQLMEAMLKDLRAHGFAFEDISAKDILQAKNTVGIDIGEGTVNFPVFLDGKFNNDASSTFAKGYGTVLEQARERLIAENMPFGSRKALAEFMTQEPSPLQRARYNKVKRVVDEEISGFVMEVINEFHKVMSRAGAYVEVLYVYGGGATPIKEYFYPAVLTSVKNLGGEDVMFPVLYLDSRYSRYLNREGLYIVAKNLADRG
jgi:plasmid segregation protein ParM